MQKLKGPAQGVRKGERGNSKKKMPHLSRMEGQNREGVPSGKKEKHTTSKGSRYSGAPEIQGGGRVELTLENGEEERQKKN